MGWLAPERGMQVEAEHWVKALSAHLGTMALDSLSRADLPDATLQAAVHHLSDLFEP